MSTDAIPNAVEAVELNRVHLHQSRYNAVKHGLTSNLVVMPDEDDGEFERHRLALRERLAAEGPEEEQLVEIVAGAHWRLARCRRMEADLLTRRSSDGSQDLTAAEALRSDLDVARACVQLTRHESALFRQLMQATRTLTARQALRGHGAGQAEDLQPGPGRRRSPSDPHPESPPATEPTRGALPDAQPSIASGSPD